MGETRSRLGRSWLLLVTSLLVVVSAGCSSEGPTETSLAGASGEIAIESTTMPSVTGGSAPAAPDFVGSTITGAQVSGSALWSAGPVVMVFFASWCPGCRSAQADWTALSQQYSGRATFVGVIPQEKAADVQRYLAEHPVSYQVISDPERTLWRTFAVSEPPLVVLIDKGGKLVRGWPGGVARAELETALNGLVR